MKPKKKPRQSPRRSSIDARISGSVSGQVAIGENITQTRNTQSARAQITEAELETLRSLIAELKAQVASTETGEKQATALGKVSELEEAITTKTPDVSTMEYVRNWFVKNVPQLAGAVTGLVVNPIVGKLVEAAGETVAHEFKRRFGIA
jgi:hypothetical protein